MDNVSILNSIRNLNISDINTTEELDEDLLLTYSNEFEAYVINGEISKLLDTFMSVEDLGCNGITKCAILYIGSQFVNALVNAEENNC